MRKNKCIWRENKSLILVIIITIIMSIIISSDVFALGVAPSRKVVDYEAGVQTITARVINNDNQDMNFVIYAQGELAEYVQIEKTTLSISKSEPEKEFRYTYSLPSNLTPGQHNINIIIMQVPDKVNVGEESQTTILSTLSVAHQLRINVPYPGNFAEGVLYISEGNVNSTITFTANILNRGTQTIKEARGELVIKGPTNEEIARVKSNELFGISPQVSDKLVVNWYSNVNPGLYYAEFIVNYDNEQFVLRKTFMIGEYYVDIRNIKVEQFKLGTIAKFDVELLNKWNQPVDSVYADMQVIDNQGAVLAVFKTAPSSINQLDTTTITGYWDTKDVNVGTYDIKVILNYAGKASERIFKTVVGIDSIQVQDFATLGKVIESPGKASNLSLLYILVLVSIVFNIGLFVYFKFIRNKQP